MPRMFWNIAIIVVLLLGGVFIAGTRVQPDAGVVASAPTAPSRVASDPAPLPDHPAPNFALADLDGRIVELNDLRGQVTLINVWATWCPPCRAEMPAIQSVYEQYRDQGFTVLAVNTHEDPDVVTAFMDQHALTFPALLDQDGAVSQTYRASVMPSSFFVDRQGVIRAVYKGPMSRGVIAGTVEQLVQEGE